MEALRAICGVHASGLSRTEAGIYPAPTPPSRGHDSSSISPSQNNVIPHLVRVETLPQYMEALCANRGVHASGLSRTEAGLCEAPCGLALTDPSPHADMTHH